MQMEDTEEHYFFYSPQLKIKAAKKIGKYLELEESSYLYWIQGFYKRYVVDDAYGSLVVIAVVCTAKVFFRSMAAIWRQTDRLSGGLE